MQAGHINRVVGRLRTVALGAAGERRSDAQLLDSFVARREPAAFETLLKRHGPMVLGVCKRVLGNDADAEDAFQATFLVLVRKAASVMPRDRVGNWLYGVACRTAMKARAMSGKRRARERQASTRLPTQAGGDASWSDLQAVLDEELERLPEKYRTPVVLCDLEGKTHREAARLLGWPDGTLTTRLIAARRLLARRLTRRGLALSAGALGALLTQNAATAGVPALLAGSTARAAALAAAGETSWAVSAKVAALTQGVLKAMLITKLKTAAGALLALVLIGATAGGLIYRGDAAGLDTQAAGEQTSHRAAVDPPAEFTQVVDDKPAEPGVARTGVVTKIADDLVQVNLGSNHGIQAGNFLEIYRLQPVAKYLGRAKVLDANVDSCVAQLKVMAGVNVKIGDQATTELLPKSPPTGQSAGPKDAEKKSPLPSGARGTITRVDGANNLLEISLGSVDGLKENQLLHVYKQGPKPMYLGPIKVLATFTRSAVARPLPIVTPPIPAPAIHMSAGDQVSDVPPEPPPGLPKELLGLRGPAADKPDSPRQDPRRAAALFLAAAVSAGKIDDARPLLHPSLPKAQVEAVKGAAKQSPPLALVQVDTEDALAITGPFDWLGAPNDLQGRVRLVIRLKRATHAQIMSGWFASDWLIADVNVRDGETTLRELLDFLHRHPSARPAPAEKAAPGN